VVIDFIDMENQRNQREVENRLRDALHYDRARVQTGKISRFGLLELSRQRLRSSLGESNHMPCPRCHGTGHIRGIESTALHILRITQEEAMKENSAIIQVQLPVEAATFLLNEKRAEIHKIEQRMGVQVVLIPNIHMETPNYTITRIRHDDVAEEHTRASYQMVEMPISDIEEAIAAAVDPKIARVEAAVKGITPASPAPMEKPLLQNVSLVSRIKGWFSRIAESKPDAAPQTGGRNDDSRARRGNKPNRNAHGNDRKNAQEKRPQQRQEQRPDRQERPDRPERQERQDRQNQQRTQRQDQQRAEKVESDKPAVPNGQPNGNETGEGRSRRGRGRRDRGNRGERQPNQQTHAEREEKLPVELAPATVAEEKVQQPATPVPVPTPAPVEVAQTAAAPAEKTRARKEEPSASEQAVESAKPAREPRSRQPAAAREAAETSTASEVSEAQQQAEVNPEPKKSEAQDSNDKDQKAEKKPRQPRRRKPEADKPVDLAAIGLQLVETKADAKADPAPEPEQAASKSRKEAAWKKKSAEPAKDEPLVIVQTQK